MGRIVLHRFFPGVTSPESEPFGGVDSDRVVSGHLTIAGFTFRLQFVREYASLRMPRCSVCCAASAGGSVLQPGLAQIRYRELTPLADPLASEEDSQEKRKQSHGNLWHSQHDTLNLPQKNPPPARELRPRPAELRTQPGEWDPAHRNILGVQTRRRVRGLAHYASRTAIGKQLSQAAGTGRDSHCSLPGISLGFPLHLPGAFRQL